MEIVQLELDLWQSLDAAARSPETANLDELYKALDLVLVEKPLQAQLQVGGQALMRMAEVFATRAEYLIAGWENRYNPKEPVISLDDCSDLFAQSMCLELDDLFEEPEPSEYPANRKSAKKGTDSAVGEVDKQVWLSVLEKLKPAPELTAPELAQRVLELAHEEAVSLWGQKIRDYFAAHFDSDKEENMEMISFLDLAIALDLEKIPLWLGLLHSQEFCRMQQVGEFYSVEGVFVIANEISLGKENA